MSSNIKKWAWFLGIYFISLTLYGIFSLGSHYLVKIF